MRISWDTNVKHYVRSGLYHNLPSDIINQIPSSNLSRWKNESEDKYLGSEATKYINQDIELYKKIGQSSNIKKMNEGYFKLVDVLHEILHNVKGFKQKIADNKDFIVNTIENIKEIIPIENAIKIFNISRSTYQNYKTLVINKCDASYFLWCVKKYPHQLLKKEILVIKDYMADEKYRYWSKSSVYLKAIRDEKLYCCLSTFYKYCRLLGFKEKRKRQKSDDYAPVKTTHPNELWCADVTIFKTADGVKHYIHFLMDHYSRMILGYTVEKSSNGQAIKRLLQNAYMKFKPQNVTFLTDGATENVNNVSST